MHPPNKQRVGMQFDILSIFGRKKDNQRDHKFGDVVFQVDKRYINLAPIGRGSFGEVVSAYDNFRKEFVAIKKVSKAFRHQKSAERLFREIFMLRQFDNKNVIKLIDIERPLDPNSYNDVYLITELMTCDLRKLIYSNVCFNEYQMKNMFHQIIAGVHYIHENDVIHRDLKPSNILVNVQNGGLKLADFGLSTREHGSMDRNVVTRWYRAPELLYPGNIHYGKPIDIWSVGCVFAELLFRRPLFCGSDRLDQLFKIFEVLGKPEIDQLVFPREQKHVKELMKLYNSIQKIDRPFLHREFEKQEDGRYKRSQVLFSLLTGMFEFDPKKRLTAAQVINHPFFKEFKEKEKFDRESLKKRVDFSIVDSSYGQGPQKFRQLIHDQIREFHPEKPIDEINQQFYDSMEQFINSDLPQRKSIPIPTSFQAGLKSVDPLDCIVTVEDSSSLEGDMTIECDIFGKIGNLKM